MNSSHPKQLIALTLLVALTAPLQLAAQGQQQSEKTEHVRYRLIDLGTLGGPQSFGDLGHGAGNINNGGTAAGVAETTTADPYFPNFNPISFFPDPFVHHAFKTKNGSLVDLGALPGTNSSSVNFISESGLVAGQSLNGATDPFTGWPEQDAVLWKDGKIITLGMLGGYESAAIGVNSRAQAVGFSGNAVPDPFSFFGLGTETRAFLWDQENGMQDLGTLGGPDGFAQVINERGQIAGFSYTNFAPNSATTIPTVDPFLWQHGTMIDLGTLGGTIGTPSGINNQGQVVGLSGLAGDQTSHPFLWPGADGKMQDLGTLGGSFGMAEAINDAGEVVGTALTVGDSALHAFFWKDGMMIDLGTAGGFDCSDAHAINSKGQVVGDSFACAVIPPPPSSDNAFLWQDGHMIDLNVFVPPGSNLILPDVETINDRGEMFGSGVLPNGDMHAFLLIPCEMGEEGCVDSAEAATSVPRSTASIALTRLATAQANSAPGEAKDRTRALLARRNRRFGVWAPK